MVGPNGVGKTTLLKVLAGELEQALDSFPGTLLLVTHHRRLAASVWMTRDIDVPSLRA